LDDYLLPRWGSSFALDIEPDQIEEWLDAQELENPTKEKIRRVMNVVYRRGQKSGLLPRTGDGNPVAFVTQSSKSSYKSCHCQPGTSLPHHDGIGRAVSDAGVPCCGDWPPHQ
jgi:hypothetical protein